MLQEKNLTAKQARLVSSETLDLSLLPVSCVIAQGILEILLELLPYCCISLFLYFSDSKSGFITFASCIIAGGIALKLQQPYFSFLQLPRARGASFVSEFSRTNSRRNF